MITSFIVLTLTHNEPKFLNLWLFFFLFFATAELCGHLLLRVLQQLYSKRQARGTRCPERSSAFHCIVQEGQGWAKASGVAGETTTNSSVTPKRAYVYPGGEGGRGWHSIKFNTGRLRSPYHIVCHFGEKDTPFVQYSEKTSSLSRSLLTPNEKQVLFIKFRLCQESGWQISLPFQILRLECGFATPL